MSLYDMYMGSGSNIYGIHNYGNMDNRLITGSYHGTPMYQMAGYNYSPQMQAFMDKNQRWNALSPELKLAYSSNPDYYVSNEERIRALDSSRYVSPERQAAIKDLMYRQNRARAEALIANSPPGSMNANLGHDILSNNTFSQLSLLYPHSKVALPEGNQLARAFMSGAGRGVMPSDDLMSFANQADAFADWWNPSGQWNAWFSGSGSREGMGGVGSGAYFRGNLGHVFSGNADESMYSPTGTAGKYYKGSGALHGPALPPGWKTGPNGKAIPPSGSGAPNVQNYRWPGSQPGGSKLADGSVTDRFGRATTRGPANTPLARSAGGWVSGSDWIEDSGITSFDPRTGQVYRGNEPGLPDRSNRVSGYGGYTPISSREYMTGGNNSAYFDGERNVYDSKYSPGSLLSGLGRGIAGLGSALGNIWDNGMFNNGARNIPGMVKGETVAQTQQRNSATAFGRDMGGSMFGGVQLPGLDTAMLPVYAGIPYGAEQGNSNYSRGSNIANTGGDIFSRGSIYNSVPYTGRNAHRYVPQPFGLGTGFNAGLAMYGGQQKWGY